jgi:hypothetical protein
VEAAAFSQNGDTTRKGFTTALGKQTATEGLPFASVSIVRGNVVRINPAGSGDQACQHLLSMDVIPSELRPIGFREDPGKVFLTWCYRRSWRLLSAVSPVWARPDPAVSSIADSRACLSSAGITARRFNHRAFFLLIRSRSRKSEPRKR